MRTARPRSGRRWWRCSGSGPGGGGWAEITAGVLEAGSAVAVWQRLVPPVLVSPPGEPDALDAAARQIAGWAGAGMAAC